MSGIRKFVAVVAAVVPAVLATGCHPFGLGIFTPIPVQPWVAEKHDRGDPVRPQQPVRVRGAEEITDRPRPLEVSGEHDAGIRR